MRNLLFILILLLQNIFLFSQPSIEWQKCLGGTGYDEPSFLNPAKDMFQQTADHGYIIAGTSNSIDGDVTGFHGGSGPDYWVIKTDSLGNIEWQKCLGGTSSEWATAIQQTNDGGYIVAGITGSNNGDVSGNHGYSDYWLIKLDSAGNIQWKKCYGGGYGTVSGYDNPYSIRQTLEGGYIVAGRSNSGNGDVTGLHVASWYYSDYWIVKLDTSGNIQWQKCLGGYLDEEAHSIALSNDSGFVIAGEARSYDGDVTGNHDTTGNTYDYWVVKLNSSGNILWQKCYGGSENDIPSSISNTSDGGFIIAGQTSSNDGDVIGYNAQFEEGWIIKIDSIGNLQWQKCLGGQASTAVQTSDGGFLIAGNVAPNDSDQTLYPNIEYFWLVKLDSAHNFQWHSCDGYKNGGYCNTAIQTYDGKYAFLGNVYNNGGDVTGAHGGKDIWLVKLSDLNIIKSKQREICSLCNGFITINATGGTPPYSFLWSTGETTDSISNLCHGTYSVTVTDAMGLIGACSENIMNDTVRVYGTQTPASCWSCPDGTATLHPTGGSGLYHYSWQGFSDTTATLTGLPNGSVYGCVTDSFGCAACYSIEVMSPVGLDEISDKRNFIYISPNPTSDKIYIESSEEFGQINSVQVYNSIGELVIFVENSITIDFASMKSGIYFIIATNMKGHKLKAIAMKMK